MNTPRQQCTSPSEDLDHELSPVVLDKCLTLWEELAEVSQAAPAGFRVNGRELLRWYAEAQYRLRGGGHCDLCRAHVRHAVPVMVERNDGAQDRFQCLCTRCLVAEEKMSSALWYRVGDKWVESGAW